MGINRTYSGRIGTKNERRLVFYYFLLGYVFLINNDLVHKINIINLKFQLKPNPMKENVLMNHCGQFLKSIIKNHVTYTICFIEEKLSVVSYTITV